MQPTAEHLKRIRAHYDAGLYLQAYEMAHPLAPLRDWLTTDARVMAGRLAMNLGAPRLGHLLHWSAFRRDPTAPLARYYHALCVLDSFGPHRAWHVLRHELEGAGDRLRADWIALRATVLARFRDFDRAEAELAEADRLKPDDAWLAVERAHLLELEDRHEDALGVARRALGIRPWYRPAVQSAAHLLGQLERSDEAIALLTEASEHIECCSLFAHRAHFEVELKRYHDARESLERYRALAPLLEKHGLQWLNARRSDAAYYDGDFERAAEYAREAGNPFHEKMVERLLKPPAERERILLDVGFVRQHHMTCAPATLSAMVRYWGHSADHLDVAEAICYDGTPDHSERHWADTHGFVTREFAVTEESAIALLDRGIPFTLTTIEVGSGHLQAVIGYDKRRGSLLVRDPNLSHFAEYETEVWLKRHRVFGPRGMAMVPVQRAELLDGLELPDADLYDRYFQLQRALIAHRRQDAADVLERMVESSAGHRLTIQARLSLAAYDGDTSRLLAGVEELLLLFPGDGRLRMRKLSYLRQIGSREERLSLLREAVADKDRDPAFYLQLAQELRADARERPQVVRLLRRAARSRPLDAGLWYTLAATHWDEGERETASCHYRFAACLEDKDESLCRSYFIATRWLKRTDEALAFMRRRFERYGRKACWPAQTLFWAHDVLDRQDEGFTMLEEALSLRPEDGDLLLFSADAHARFGRFDRAGELLKRAEGHSRPTSWLRTAGELAAYRGVPADALRLWRQLLDHEPLALDAHRAVAQLLAETESREAALDHLYQAATRFPHHFGLHQLCIDWLRDDGDEEMLPFVEHLIDIDPLDAWSRREHALLLTRLRRYGEADAALREAEALEPRHSALHTARGDWFAAQGRREDARASYRRAVEISVDDEYAISRLMGTAAHAAEEREALGFVRQELIRQVLFGDGLLAYRQVARHVIPDEELLAHLQEALSVRPDLWHAWAATIRHLADMERLEEAMQLADQALQRFPLIPRLWMDRAIVCFARKDWAGERVSLEQALQISPNWGWLLRTLAGTYEREGNFGKSREILESAVARSPLEAANYGCLADTLWKMDCREDALARLRHAVLLDPGYQWAWDTLAEWSAELERPALAADLARNLTERRPGEARSWLVLAQILSGPPAQEERLAALEKALALNPRLVDAYDLRATLLVEAGRFDDALATCNAPIWNGQEPASLRGRAAWILAERGDLENAIAAMRRVVEDLPGYYWGWSRLADWHARREDWKAYEDAARQLVKLSPREGVPYGYLGDAFLKQNKRAEAKDAFRRAVQFDASYFYGTFHLFDLLLDDGELDEAEQVLTAGRPHLPKPNVLARLVRLQSVRKKRKETLDALKELCVQKSESSWPIEHAWHYIGKANWIEEGAKVLEEVVEAEGVHPYVGELLTKHLAGKKSWWNLSKLMAKRSSGSQLWKSMAACYIEALAEAQRKQPLTFFVRDHREALRTDAYLWGTVGYALSTVDDHRGCIRWMEDWRDRQGVTAWMLSNLLLSYREVGMNDKAAEVARRALRLPADHTTGLHALWLAWDGVCQGNAVEARAQLKDVKASELREYYQHLHGLVAAVLFSLEAEPGSEEGFRGAREALRDIDKLLQKHRKFTLLMRAHRQALSRIAARRGGPFARFWQGWNWLDTLQTSWNPFDALQTS